MKQRRNAVFLLPIRRRLMALTVACLCGVYLTCVIIIPCAFCICGCAVFAGLGLVRLCKRQSALACACAALLLFGHTLAGSALLLRDLPTEPGVSILGTVSAIEQSNQVYLTGVTMEDGQTLQRAVLVTLMEEEGAPREAVQVGQQISGTGRLFAQQEPRNPGGVNQRIQALEQGYELSGYILPGWTVHGKPVFSPGEWLRTVREDLLAHMERVFGESAPLFQGILLGERQKMDADVITAMRLTGTVHILTVSGMHLSLLAMAVAWVLRRLPIGRWFRFGMQIALLTFFACLTGGAPGTIRALIMATMRALAVCRGQRYDPLTSLSAAALIMTLVNPLRTLTASFQFSFFVVLGILLLANGLHGVQTKRLAVARRFPRLVSALQVCASAQIAALPMQLLLYGYVPVYALPMNLITGLLMPVLMTGGVFCTAVGALCLPLGRGCAWVFSVPAMVFEHLSLFVSGLPGGICRLPSISGLLLALFAVTMALLSPAIRFGRGRYRAFVGCLLLMLIGYLPCLNPAARYVQLDVGQGDAAVLRKGRQALMVDVGPEDSYDALRYVRHEGLLVDTVILSHLDEDHMGGLSVLLQSEVDVERIVLADPSGEKLSETARSALELAQQMDVPVEIVSAGDSVIWADVRFEVLSPKETLKGSNERSLVLYADFEGMRVLLTGDLPIECEMERPPECDVLKVAHHGSKNASSLTFLEKTSPQIALISVGAENGYGHPTQRVLDDLQAVGAIIYRTDECGCITLWPGTKGMRVQTYL